MLFNRSVLIFTMISYLAVPFIALADDGQTAYWRALSIYKDTYAKCSKTGLNTGLKTEIRTIWESFSLRTMRDGLTQELRVVTLDPRAIGEVVANKGLTTAVAQSLDSPAFHLALHDCYGNDVSLQHAYIAGMIASDVSGKVVGVAVTIAVGWAAIKILAAAAQAYPLITYGVSTAAGIALSARVYKSIRDLTRDATPEEKAAAEAIIDKPLQDGITRTELTKQRLRDKINSLKTQMQTASPDEQKDIAERITVLRDDIDHLDHLENETLTKG